MDNMAKIELKDMLFYANHGCFDEERLIGTRFLVDVLMETKGCPAAFSDRLEDAVDYSRVYELVAAEMLRSSLLLEHVAGRIIRAVTAEFALEDCVVTVSKLTPAVGGQVGRASVTLSMKELNNGQS